MLITLFVLIWVGVFFLGQAYNLALAAKSQARGCAFVTASESCEHVPEFCVVSVEDGPQSEEEVETQDALLNTSAKGRNAEENQSSADDPVAPGDEPEVATASADQRHVAKGANNEMDSEIKNGLFRRAKSVVNVSLDRPESLGGDSVSLDQGFSLPCNPKPGTMEDKIMDLLMQAFGKK